MGKLSYLNFNSHENWVELISWLVNKRNSLWRNTFLDIHYLNALNDFFLLYDCKIRVSLGVKLLVLSLEEHTINLEKDHDIKLMMKITVVALNEAKW